MKKVLMTAFAAMLLPMLAAAQFAITGKVTGLSQQPLAGASISLTGTLWRSQTDASGNFKLKNLEQGVYTLRIAYIGYKTIEQTIRLDEDQKLHIELQPDILLSDEVIVSATRARTNSPTTFRNLSRQEIEKNNMGQDLPYLLNYTPSVVVTSDAGTGIGYTGVRIRGSDPTRINVTVNGIPYNDAESQGSFWVNLPDFASSVDNIQVQRGVGTSTNGAGAFGASLNIQTNVRRDTAYAELNNSFGSYATMKNTVNIGTGLMNGKFSVDGRLSRIKSDGYIDRAFADLKSFFLSGAYYGKKSLLRANVFSGKEKTYQAWNGVPESMLASNRTYNSFTYDDQTDNYTQNHYQLLYSHAFSNQLSFNGALHYTQGSGYYEEYREDDSLVKYGLQDVIIGGSTIKTTDLIRRRWLDNDFYGITYSLNYTPVSNLELTLGGAYNEYDGKHYGEVIWAQYASDGKIRQRYYDNDAFKTDFNVFGKASWQLGDAGLFADLQYRRIGYSFLGYNRNLENVQQKATLNFFNPKVGVSYQLDGSNSVYASFAVGNREPNRNDYTESSPVSRPKPENLKDIEAGFRSAGKKYAAGVNLFGMFYKDQLVLTGQINDVGAYIRSNVPDSYRIGAEVDGKWNFSKGLSWAVTASLSSNKIKDYSEFVDIYNDAGEWTGQQENKYSKTDIAFSPAFVASSELAFAPFKNTEMALLSKYVGKQYLDNTSNTDRKIDAYFVNDLRLSYHTSFSTLKNIGLTLLVNNVFDELYVSNGYIYGENYYFPQATRNFLLSLSLKF